MYTHTLYFQYICIYTHCISIVFSYIQLTFPSTLHPFVFRPLDSFFLTQRKVQKKGPSSRTTRQWPEIKEGAEQERSRGLQLLTQHRADSSHTHTHTHRHTHTHTFTHMHSHAHTHTHAHTRTHTHEQQSQITSHVYLFFALAASIFWHSRHTTHTHKHNPTHPPIHPPTHPTPHTPTHPPFSP